MSPSDSAPPDDTATLDQGALRAALVGTRWRDLEVVAETGSTNADLLARAASGADISGAVLVAEHQSAGRGRRGRTWSAAPRDQISMSVGVSAVEVPVDRWGWLSLATGLAVVDAIADLTGVDVGLKWPNDVLGGSGPGKVAGILAEVARPAIVVGVGLNVHAVPADVDRAVSLCDLGSARPHRGQVIVALLQALDTRVAQWRCADPRLERDYRARSLTIGASVRAYLPGDVTVEGTATGIDEQGRLHIDTGGSAVVVSAGDVVHLR